jgi:hypothetical protein
MMYERKSKVLATIQGGVDNLQVTVVLLKIIQLSLVYVSECEHGLLSFLQVTHKN